MKAKTAHIETCVFRFEHDEDLSPVGPACGRPATQLIHWVDGRSSTACELHGFCALDPSAHELVERIEPLDGGRS